MIRPVYVRVYPSAARLFVLVCLCLCSLVPSTREFLGLPAPSIKGKTYRFTRPIVPYRFRTSVTFSQFFPRNG